MASTRKIHDIVHIKTAFGRIFLAIKKLIIIYIDKKMSAVQISVPIIKESDWSSAFLMDVLPRA